MTKAKNIKITTEYITLGQFLKFASIIDQGGEAKGYLFTHEVKVDGVVEDRRGRKLRGGETVEAEGQTFLIVR